MLKEFYHSARDFKKQVKNYVTFNVIILVFSSILFIPSLSYFVNRLFLSRDTGVILNRDLFKVVLSFQGILIFMGISLLGFILLFIILGTQLIYSEMVIKDQPITMIESFLTTLRAMPKLLRFELLYFVFFVFLIIPLIEYEANPLIRYFMETPPTLLDSLDLVPWGEIAYSLALLVIFYIFLRTIFVFHGILLESKSIRGSLKRSLELTKGITLPLLLKLVILNGVLFGVLLGGYYLIAQIPEVFNLPVNYVVRQYVITMAGIGMVLYFMMIIPINLLFLTRRYHQLNQEFLKGEYKEVKLIQWPWLMTIEKNIIETKFLKKTTFGLFLFLSILIVFTVGFKVNQDFLYKGRNILIAAHRGDEKIAPENTLAAITSAVEHGADFVEIDLQMTKDGMVVIHHDSSLIRTAGIAQSIHTLSYDEIKGVDVGSHFEDSFHKERIPTLEEVFLLYDEESKFLLDVKTNGDEDDLAREIINLIKAYGMEDRVLIQSFNYSFLKKMRKKDETLKLGQIMYAAFGRLEELDVDFYTVKKNMLTKQLISRARKADKGIFVWVIEREEELKDVMTYDIDGVITSNLNMTYQVLRSELELDGSADDKPSTLSFQTE